MRPLVKWPLPARQQCNHLTSSRCLAGLCCYLMGVLDVGETATLLSHQVNEMRAVGSSEATDELYALANRSNFSAYSYSGAIINGVKFLVEQRDVRLTTQNNGILVPDVGGQNYYGVLQDVIELCYVKDCMVLIFKCKCFDTNPRRRRIQEDNRFTSIYTGAEWYKNDPFILASQAKSVYYLNDIKNDPMWKLVRAYAPHNVWDYPNIEVENDVDRTTTDAHVVQELNSQPLQLVVELPELENVSFYRDDIKPTEVINIDQLQQNIGDFVVDDDDFQDDTLEEYDEEDDGTVEIDDDDSIDIETNGTTSEEADPMTGELLSVIDTFEKFFHKGGQWKNDWAAQKHAEMVDLRLTQSESEVFTSTVDNVHQPKDVNIMTQVLGSRYRYVKGLGLLLKLSVVGGSRATNISLKHHDDFGKFAAMQKMIDEQNLAICEHIKNLKHYCTNFNRSFLASHSSLHQRALQFDLLHHLPRLHHRLCSFLFCNIM
ncbi:hypothetical protein ZIOFF_023082 [Zingiber officinale]|uniref:DUF4216 domain-containing protein n=1 Tax=Zingiber officinale TaxID=94328 RepID=A0A8J5LKN2_ZINOF|nr:hypothetical protein ZIOFF_023082 [Zingiber officinale]